MSLDSFFNPITHTTHWSADGQSAGWDQQDPLFGTTHHNAHGQVTGRTVHDGLGNAQQYDQSGHLVASSHPGILGQTVLTDGAGHVLGHADPRHDHLFLADGGMVTSSDLIGGHTQFHGAGLADPLVNMQTIRFTHFAA